MGDFSFACVIYINKVYVLNRAVPPLLSFRLTSVKKYSVTIGSDDIHQQNGVVYAHNYRKTCRNEGTNVPLHQKSERYLKRVSKIENGQYEAQVELN